LHYDGCIEIPQLGDQTFFKYFRAPDCSLGFISNELAEVIFEKKSILYRMSNFFFQNNFSVVDISNTNYAVTHLVS
jgi:hypothetical protein